MPMIHLLTGNQTVIPTDLKTQKYSITLPFFNSNGENMGKKIPQKNEFCKRSRRSVRLYEIQVGFENCWLCKYCQQTNYLMTKTFPTVFLRSKSKTYGCFNMNNQYPQIVEKSLKVIEHLTEKFGWFTIRVYQFPLIPGFETYEGSVEITAVILKNYFDEFRNSIKNDK